MADPEITKLPRAIFIIKMNKGGGKKPSSGWHDCLSVPSNTKNIQATFCVQLKSSSWTGCSGWKWCLLIAAAECFLKPDLSPLEENTSPMHREDAFKSSCKVALLRADTLRQTLTLVAASGTHARLKICRVRAGNAQVQLSLQHPLPHPLALFASGRAAGGPRRPVGVDAGLRRVICRSTSREDQVTAGYSNPWQLLYQNEI